MKSKRLLLSIFMTCALSSCSFFKEVLFVDDTAQTEDQPEEPVVEEVVQPETKEEPKEEPKVEPKQEEPVQPVEPIDETVYYKITFRNYDNSVLAVVNTPEGELPVYSGKEPTRPSTNYEKYNFAGWNPTITVATADIDYVAKFVTVDVTFNVSFYMDDKKTLLYSNEYKYGQMPTIPNDPTKNETASTTYTFKGWDKQVVAVTGNAKYYAVFTATTKKFRVTFYDDDNVTVLQTGLWDYNSTPKFNQSTPVKQSSASANYKFKGWNKTIAKVTSDQEYVAVYESNTKTYKVTFLNEDGSTLQEGEYEYGAMPSCPEPTKDSTNQTKFTFAGWEPSIKAVTSDITYIAKFDSVGRTYRITFYNYNFTELRIKNLGYGEATIYDGATPTKPNSVASGRVTKYTFVGWSDDKTKMNISNAITTLPAVSADANYYAVFSSESTYDYSLTWSSYNGIKNRTINLLDTTTYAAIKNDITWTSNNTSVAKVDSTGKVTPVGVGTATITALTPDGQKRTCNFQTIDAYLELYQNHYQGYRGVYQPCSFFFGIKNNDKLTQPIKYTTDYYTISYNGTGNFWTAMEGEELYIALSAFGEGGTVSVTFKLDTNQKITFNIFGRR